MTLGDGDGKPELKESGVTKEEEEGLKLEETSEHVEGDSSSPGIKRPFDQMSATSSSSTPKTEKQLDEEVLTVKSDDNGEASNNSPSLAASSSCDNPSTSAAFQNDVGINNSRVSFKVVFAKETYDITMDETNSVRDLKDHIFTLTGISHDMQKLCFKGAMQDSKTLKESAVKNGTKILMIGSKINEVITLNSTPKPTEVAEERAQAEKKEPLCQQTIHKKVLDKGKPDFALPAWLGIDSPLPPEPLTGMINKYQLKTRLTFKLETDELWVSTKVRTTKLHMSNIKSVISEPIESDPKYHILGIQIGPTEQSRLWFYWVPAQYIKAIKSTILG